MALSDQIAAMSTALSAFGASVDDIISIAADLVDGGWVKFPLYKNGTLVDLIIQMDTVAIPTGDNDTVTFPIAYPNAEIITVGCDTGAGTHICSCAPGTVGSFKAYGWNPATGAYAETTMSFISIGY